MMEKVMVKAYLLLLDLRIRSFVKHEPAIETLAKFMSLENDLLLCVRGFEGLNHIFFINF